MSTTTTIDTFTLALGDIHSVASDERHRITALDGTLWVTVGDGRDLVLEEGQFVLVDGPRAALVSALGREARFGIEVEPALALAA